jgi:non-specific serine/threonine protein kinase
MDADVNLLRRPAADASAVWSFGNAELDDLRHELRVDGHPVALESKPYALLRVLLQRAGETLSKDELIDTVWSGRIVTEGVLAKCVTKLRSALGDDDQSIIRTVHGYGYRLAAAVESRPVQPAPAWRPGVAETLPARPHWRFVRAMQGGGFGEVWLAEHAKTHEQRVFKFAADGAQLHALKREITLYRLLRDSLGERAEIVRIIDWNLDEPPYFVESEYLPGGNLIEWCERRGGPGKVDREVRLAIVAGIADALAAAHSIGVLHKDLKPANVLLVDTDAAAPAVRLVDFGSGRALEPVRLAELGITHLGLTQTRADGDSTSGTPYYLAPELIAGRPATLRADVYALGVILYQLLVGDFRVPLSPGWERDVAPQALGGDASIESELLREDIAAAADVDPERRLGDAGELARRLRSLPERVEQRRRERAEAQAEQRRRVGLLRWQVRRRWLLALCAVLVLASVVVASLYVRVQREAAVQRAVNAFLNDDLLAAADPHAAPRGDLRVHEVLDRARERVGARFAGRPEEEAAIRATLGNSYSGIGDYAEARRQFERALALRQGGDAQDDTKALALRRSLADVAVLETRYDDAQAAYAKLREEAIASRGTGDAFVLDIDLALAHLLVQRGRHDEAARVLEALVPRARDRYGETAAATLAAVTDLGQSYRNTARFDQAEAAYRTVYEARRASLGAEHWHTLESLQDLAQLARSRGDLDAAVGLETTVVAAREKSFGRDHAETLNAINELASLYQDQHRFDAAEPLFREVLAARERTLGERHEHTRNSMNNLGLLLKLEGKLDEAEALYRRVLAIETQILGGDDLQVLILMHNLAGLERDRGRLADAEALQRDVVARAARTLDPARPENGLFITGLARTLHAQKRYAESADAFEQARRNLVGAYGSGHARVVKLDEMRSAMYRDWGRPVPESAQHGR